MLLDHAYGGNAWVFALLERCGFAPGEGNVMSGAESVYLEAGVASYLYPFLEGHRLAFRYWRR